MGNFNTYDTEHLIIEKHRVDLADQREKYCIDLADQREKYRIDLVDQRVKDHIERMDQRENERKKKRLEREIASYADNPLYSVKLAKWTGLRAPYQQWVVTYSSVAIVWKGLPRIQRGYWAYHLKRAIHVGDNLRKYQLMEKLKLSQSDIEIPTVKLNKIIMETKDKAAKWGALCVLTACYVARSKYMHEN